MKKFLSLILLLTTISANGYESVELVVEDDLQLKNVQYRIAKKHLDKFSKLQLEVNKTVAQVVSSTPNSQANNRASGLTNESKIETPMTQKKLKGNSKIEPIRHKIKHQFLVQSSAEENHSVSTAANQNYQDPILDNQGSSLVKLFAGTSAVEYLSGSNVLINKKINGKEEDVADMLRNAGYGISGRYKSKDSYHASIKDWLTKYNAKVNPQANPVVITLHGGL